MADEPIEALGGKTPMQYADTPYMDKLAEMGVTGRMKTVADGFHPGSEVANMAVLGYDLPTVYEGRGVLEAASIGYDLKPGEMAMRCNLICVEGDILKNHSSGHITTEEADELIRFLNEKLGSDHIHFYTGVSYRHLLIVKGGDKRLDCTPPHDVPLHPFRPLMIKPEAPEAQETADLLNNLILQSQEILKDHPVNLRRIAAGKDPANSIWPWSPGYRPAMQTMQEMYGFKQDVYKRQPFSKAIMMAKEEGYSEPDPRIDLSGKDVIRKLVILAREAGYKVEQEDVKRNLFIPESYFEGSLDDFWRNIQGLDARFEEKRQQLEAEDKRFRFVAKMENGACEVGLQEVDAHHPFYELEGSNNIIMISTERYHEYPMIIKGYGAGADVTAAGVFADIISIANIR